MMSWQKEKKSRNLSQSGGRPATHPHWRWHGCTWQCITSHQKNLEGGIHKTACQLSPLTLRN